MAQPIHGISEKQISQSLLDLIESGKPTDYATIVYFNSTNPTTATIFDNVNPPVTNDPLLEGNVANLYIGTDNSTWVYNGTNYSTKVVPASSNFYINGTNTDAGNNKTSAIRRDGSININSENTAIFANGVEGGILGNSNDGNFGVSGTSSSGIGVLADSMTGPAFSGTSTHGVGIGVSSYSGTGISAASVEGIAGEFGIGAINTGKIATFKKGGTEVASISGQGHIINALIPKEISGTYTLLAEDAGRSFIITANTTVTIPNGLPAGFNAGFSTLAGAVLTFTLGVSVVVTGGLVMQAESDCVIVPRATVNNYLTRGAI
jgi:hypothetical protein